MDTTCHIKDFRKFMDISFDIIDNAILRLCHSNGKQLEDMKAIKIQIKFDDNSIDSVIIGGEVME